MCAQGATFLADSEWLFGGTAETSGECATTRQPCTQAGYQYGEESDGTPSSEPVDRCDTPDGSNLEAMSSGICASIGGYWEAKTCSDAQAGLVHAQSNPEALAVYCTNSMYRQFFETALTGCCSAGNRVSLDAFCGDMTVAPTAYPMVPHFCEGGVSMVATAQLPFDKGECSIPGSMSGVCRANGWVVRPSAIAGQSVCKEADDAAEDTAELGEPECIVMMSGTWAPMTCAQWEAGDLASMHPAMLAGYCDSDPSGETKGNIDAALAACCPPGTVGSCLGLDFNGPHENPLCGVCWRCAASYDVRPAVLLVPEGTQSTRPSGHAVPLGRWEKLVA